MAWFTLGMPVVQVDNSAYPEEYSTPTLPARTFRRIATVLGYEARGLTVTAANAYAASLAGDTDISAVSTNSIGGGGFTVRFSYTSYTEWAEV
mgnify:CR=1 FL=1